MYDAGQFLTTGDIIPPCKVQHRAKLLVDPKQTIALDKTQFLGCRAATVIACRGPQSREVEPCGVVCKDVARALVDAARAGAADDADGSRGMRQRRRLAGRRRSRLLWRRTGVPRRGPGRAQGGRGVETDNNASGDRR